VSASKPGPKYGPRVCGPHRVKMLAGRPVPRPIGAAESWSNHLHALAIRKCSPSATWCPKRPPGHCPALGNTSAR
jgi:hypothetical protein